MIQKKPAETDAATSGEAAANTSSAVAQLSGETEKLDLESARSEQTVSSEATKIVTEKRKIEPDLERLRTESEAKGGAQAEKPVLVAEKPKVQTTLEPIIESGVEVSVTEPQKIGDGMSSYMSYQVSTKTSLAAFRKPSMTVRRRFSDFLGLRDKLAAKHVPEGRLVPSAPEKSVVALARVKVSRNVDPGSSEFIEKRRAALQRFMVGISEHPALRVDPDFREFLETESELPRATQTATLSARNVLRFFSSTADSVTKLAADKFDEPDEAVAQRVIKLADLEDCLSKFFASYDSLVENRRELVLNTAG